MADRPAGAVGDRLRSTVREGFLIMLGAAAWAFDQGDRLMERWIEQGQVSRELGRVRLEELRARAREGVRGAAAGMPIATREQVASLERRIEELTRQVEALRASRSPAAPSEEFGPTRSAGY
jgi:polyhydroxyalkanoate synthesis regulator phasin